MALAGCLCLSVAAKAEASLKIKLDDRFPSSGSCSFVVSVEGINLPSPDLVKSLSFDLPGFVDVQVSNPDSASAVKVSGRLNRPGFYPFRATLVWKNERLVASDYCVFEKSTRISAFDHVGYYVFLGRGDFWDPTHQVALWTLQNWKAFADWMGAHRADTLYVLLNGYTLAYPSEKYQNLRDQFSNNARYGFLREFIDYAHARGIRVYLTLTTDDHAEGFGTLYPETTRINRFGYAGSRRALVLEDPKVRRYISDVVAETAELYSNADGFVFHPTEEDPDRFNPSTNEAFHDETGKTLNSVSKEERYRWYNQKFAELMRSLYQTLSAKNAKAEFIMFNTWWQDNYVSIYKNILPPAFKICVWYYDEHEEQAFHKWPIFPWVDEFGAGRILYMPTGEAFLFPQDPQEQMQRHIRTDRLISAAESLGVKSCIFFAGWDLGSDEGRRRDLAIAELPTTSFVPDRIQKESLLPELYSDYFGARKRVLK
jgi:hypothetical protein